MARYIDADKFISWLDIGHLRSPSEICYSEGDVKVMIDMQHTADVVEVVRCGKCKHLTDDGFCFEGINAVVGYKKPSENDFCSYGER